MERGHINKVNIENDRFGMLIAIEETNQRDFGNVIWKCKCDCGKIVKKPISEVTRKNYSNLENNYVMGSNVAEIRRKDENPTKANTSGYQGVTYLTTRHV